MGTVNLLLDRLSGVKKTGPDKWLAKCPAHDDKSPSLSIRDLPDGRILIHCFAGCGAVDVMESIGLTVGELFPNPLPVANKIYRPFSAWDALLALKAESAIVAIGASDCAEGKMNHETAMRVAVAAGRIATALEYIHGINSGGE